MSPAPHLNLPDAWGIMANHRDGDNICSPKAQCWIMWTNPGGGFDRNMMVVRSRSGRWVRKWMRTDRLENWRVKWVPPILRDTAMGLSDKQEAEDVLERMNRVWAMPLPEKAE
jgi:hypothetical protein